MKDFMIIASGTLMSLLLTATVVAQAPPPHSNVDLKENIADVDVDAVLASL